MGNEVIISHQIIDSQNAIGSDILGMYETLKDMGFKPNLLAERVVGSERFCCINERSIQETLSNPDSFLIYSYRNKWDFGEEFLSNFRGKKIIKMYTFPPPEVFHYDSSDCYEISNQTWTDIESFTQKNPDCIFWVNTNYEKTLLQKKRILNSCIIVNPFIKRPEVEKQRINFAIIDSLINNHCNNILTVGNIIPCRGHYHLIKSISTYTNLFGSDIHLWIIGANDKIHLKSYYDSLFMTINQNNLQKHISFLGTVSKEDLYGYYLGCDAFLCMSEYESFFIPLIESQIFGLPIVTYGGTGLGEIVGNNQIILNEFDYDFAASALFTIYTDEKVRGFCRYHGLKNVNLKFSPNQIKNEFIAALDQSIYDC